MELTVVKGDKLEFTVDVMQELDGETKPYVLQENEQYFFMVGASCESDNCKIHIFQKSEMFSIKEVDLKPGTYDFDFGIKYSDGATKTLIKRSEGRLIVEPRVGER